MNYSALVQWTASASSGRSIAVADDIAAGAETKTCLHTRSVNSRSISGCFGSGSDCLERLVSARKVTMDNGLFIVEDDSSGAEVRLVED